MPARARFCARESSCSMRCSGSTAFRSPTQKPRRMASSSSMAAALPTLRWQSRGSAGAPPWQGRIAGAPTALSAIFLDAHGDRMIVTHHDDRLATLTPSNPAQLAASADVVLADNRFPEFVRPICAAARARGLTVVLDADRPTQMSDDLFRIATHVVFSSECLRATAEGREVAAALRFAAAAAGLKCTRLGGSMAAPYRAEVEALLAAGTAERI